MKNKTIMAWVLILAFAFLGAFSLKASAETADETALKKQLAKIEGSCFQKYKLGNEVASVVIDENIENEFSAGQTVKLILAVLNYSEVAIVDGKIFVQIEKINSDATIGNKIVDEFFVDNKGMIFAKGEVSTLKYDWKLPSGMESGSYRIHPYIVRGNNINVGMFRKEAFDVATEANGSNNDQILVKGSFEGEIFLNKKVEISSANQEGTQPNYSMVGVDSSGDKQVKQTVSSSFGTDKKIKITRKLYRGNYFSEDNLVEEKSDDFDIKAKGSQVITTEISEAKLDFSFPFPYYLRTIISYDEGHSIYSTIMLYDKKSPNLSASYVPFINKFPIKKGEGFELVICSNNPKMENLNMGISIKDKNGKVVETVKQDLSSGMNMLSSASIFKFTAKEDYDWLSVEANILKGDKVLDKYKVSYVNENKNETVPEKRKDYGEIAKWIIILLVVLPLAILAIWILIKRIKNNRSGMSGGPMVGIILLAMLVFSSPNSAQAASSTFSITQGTTSFGIDGEAGVGFNCGFPVAFAVTESVSDYEMVLNGDFSGSVPNITMDRGKTIAFSFLADNNGLFDGNVARQNSPFWDRMVMGGASVTAGNIQFAEGWGVVNFPSPFNMQSVGLDGVGWGTGLVDFISYSHWLGSSPLSAPSCNNDFCSIYNEITNSLRTNIVEVSDPNNIITCNNNSASCTTTQNSGTASIRIMLPAKPSAFGVFAGTAGGNCNIAGGKLMSGLGLAIPEPKTIQISVTAPPISSSYSLKVTKNGCSADVSSVTTNNITFSPPCTGSNTDCNASGFTNTTSHLTVSKIAGSSATVYIDGVLGLTRVVNFSSDEPDQTVNVTCIPSGQIPLTVSKKTNCSGSPLTTGGLVTSDVGGINCGSSCSRVTQGYVNNTPVRLTASNASGCTFVEWTNIASCEGSALPSCVVNMNMIRNPSAIFNCGSCGGGGGTPPPLLSCNVSCTADSDCQSGHCYSSTNTCRNLGCPNKVNCNCGGTPPPPSLDWSCSCVGGASVCSDVGSGGDYSSKAECDLAGCCSAGIGTTSSGKWIEVKP